MKYWLITVQCVDSGYGDSYETNITETLTINESIVEFLNNATKFYILINSIEITEQEYRSHVSTSLYERRNT